MKLDAFKNMIRGIVREELDYHFYKLQKELNEVKKAGPVIRENTKEKYDLQDKPDFKRKYSGILGMVAEGMEPEGSSVRSVLDMRIPETADPMMAATHKALTRDYSALVKKLDKF